MRPIDSPPKSKLRWLVALTKERSRRGWWAYLIWLLLYAPTAMMYVDDTGASAIKLWPLLIPVAILILQWVRPTIIVWAIISLPTFLYFGIGIYYFITNNLGPHPQWEHDSEGVILGSVFLGLLLAVCIVLMAPAKLGAFRETRGA
jgi:hypothetical protein